MKIVVIGGTGLIGSKVVADLRGRGHEAVAASPATGVDTITGAGVKEALTGAQVVVDVSNSPSFADDAVLDFFLTSGRTLLAAEEAEGVRHHVAVSIVGADRLPDSGYLRAKVAQEQLISAGGVPYTIVRATQFFEFLRGIADAATVDGTVHATPAHFQPMAAQDVADIVSEAALGEPAGVVEIAGPEAIGLDVLLRRRLAAAGDPRPVVTDPEARYFGARPDDSSLTPAGPARLGPTTYADWLVENG